MSKEAIETLKQLTIDNPIKESGNTFIDILKEKIPKAGIVANFIRKLHNRIKNAIKNGERLDLSADTREENNVMGDFFMEFLFDEIPQIMKYDENVIVLFKSFAVFVDTLKNPASYDSLQALYNGMARSKRLEAKAILIREAGKCFGAVLTTEEKEKWHQHFAKLMAAAKVILADGQSMEKAEKMVEDFEAHDVPELSKLWNKMTQNYGTTEGRQRMRQCLVTDEDRKAFKEATELNDAVFSDEQLNGLKRKNEKVYAVVYLVNSLVRAVRRREGLGAEADAFFKEVVTTPNSLLRIADFFTPSQETLNKIAAQKKLITQKFNALSVEAKKEFIDMFPYRGIYNLALLD